MGGTRSRTSRRTPRLVSDINVTPFVDVMLVLLVIFMITAPLLTAAVEVDLPQTQAAQARGQDEPLVVSVNAQGKLFLQETELDRDALIARLRAITASKPEQRIFVRGDRALPYGKVMEVMGSLSSAGFTRVALVAEIPGGPAPSRAGR
jgi:biopolymer transport protein TolR